MISGDSADRSDVFLWNWRSAFWLRYFLPVLPEPPLPPVEYGLRLHDDQSRLPVLPDPRQDDPEKAVPIPKRRPGGGALVDGQLLAERSDFEDQPSFEVAEEKQVQGQ